MSVRRVGALTAQCRTKRRGHELLQTAGSVRWPSCVTSADEERGGDLFAQMLLYEGTRQLAGRYCR